MFQDDTMSLADAQTYNGVPVRFRNKEHLRSRINGTGTI